MATLPSVKVNVELELDKAKKQAEQLQKEFKKTGEALTNKQAVGKFEKDTVKSMKKVQKETKKTEDSFKKLGTIISTALVLRAVQTFFSGSIKLAGDFNQEMVSVAKTTGLAAKEINELGDDIKNMSKRIPIAATELAKIGTVAGQLGIKGKANILEFVDVIGQGVIALPEFSGGAEQIATTVAKATNAFKINIGEADNLLSSWNELSNSTAANALEISKFIENFSGAAETMGITADIASGLGATLISMGQDGSDAGTRMSQGLTKMFKNMDKVAKLTGKTEEELTTLFNNDVIAGLELVSSSIEGIEGSTQRLTKANEIFGIIGGKSMLKLIGSTELLNENLEISKRGYEDATSLTTEFDVAMGGFNNKMKLFRNHWDSVRRDVGEKILPLLSSGFSGLNNLIGSTSTGMAALRGAILAIGGAAVLATIATLIGSFGGVVAILTAVKVAAIAAFGGIGLIATAVVAVGTAMYFAIQAHTDYSAKIKENIDLLDEEVKKQKERASKIKKIQEDLAKNEKDNADKSVKLKQTELDLLISEEKKAASIIARIRGFILNDTIKRLGQLKSDTKDMKEELASLEAKFADPDHDFSIGTGGKLGEFFRGKTGRQTQEEAVARRFELMKLIQENEKETVEVSTQANETLIISAREKAENNIEMSKMETAAVIEYNEQKTDAAIALAEKLGETELFEKKKATKGMTEEEISAAKKSIDIEKTKNYAKENLSKKHLKAEKKMIDDDIKKARMQVQEGEISQTEFNETFEILTKMSKETEETMEKIYGPESVGNIKKAGEAVGKLEEFTKFSVKTDKQKADSVQKVFEEYEKGLEQNDKKIQKLDDAFEKHIANIKKQVREVATEIADLEGTFAENLAKTRKDAAEEITDIQKQLKDEDDKDAKKDLQERLKEAQSELASAEKLIGEAVGGDAAVEELDRVSELTKAELLKEDFDKEKAILDEKKMILDALANDEIVNIANIADAKNKEFLIEEESKKLARDTERTAVEEERTKVEKIFFDSINAIESHELASIKRRGDAYNRLISNIELAMAALTKFNAFSDDLERQNEARANAEPPQSPLATPSSMIVKYHDGGVIEGGARAHNNLNSSEVPIIAQKGEFMVKRSVAQGNMNMLEKLNSGVPADTLSKPQVISQRSSTQNSAKNIYFTNEKVENNFPNTNGDPSDIMMAMRKEDERMFAMMGY